MAPGECSSFTVERSKQRLDLFLSESMPSCSRARLQSLIKQGQVLVNGSSSGVKASLKLKQGDHVSCTVPPPPPMEALPEDIPIDIVYEDDAVVVVEKVRTRTRHSKSQRDYSPYAHASPPTKAQS